MDDIIEKDCLEVLQKIDVSLLAEKTFLITGSNGLIGRYFVALLDAANRQYGTNSRVFCISKHPPVWTNKEFTFITQDIAQPFLFEHKVDFIIHAAGYAQPQLFLKNELETLALNIDATRTLLEIARSCNASFLFLSSSEVYGSPPASDIPTHEDYPGNALTSDTRAAYRYSKKMGEVLCYIYARNYGVRARVARLGPTFGPGLTLSDERVIGQFMRKAIREKHIRMMDSGSSLRAFCYISDALYLMLKIVLQGREVLYNVGGVETVSIADIARLTAEHCGATFEGTAGTGLTGAPDVVKLDVTKACREFTFDGFTPFREGLRRTIDWNLQREKKIKDTD